MAQPRVWLGRARGARAKVPKWPALAQFQGDVFRVLSNRRLYAGVVTGGVATPLHLQYMGLG